MPNEVKLTQCEKAEILTQSNDLICVARVEVVSSEKLRMLLPCKVFKHGQTSQGSQRCYVRFFDRRGLITCDCNLRFLRLTDEHGIWECQINRQLDFENRRQDFKVPVNIKGTASFLRKTRKTQKQVSCSVDIVNLSTGGAYIACYDVLQVGSEVRLCIPLTDNNELDTEIRVLRNENLDAVGGCLFYGHGCQFIDLSASDEQTLRRYLNLIQLEQRKKVG